MASIVLQSICLKCKSWTNTKQSFLILDLKPMFISIISEWMSIENITETDYICQSCWEQVLEFIKVTTTLNSKYKETNSNIISDPLALKAEHSCSDDEHTDNSYLPKPKIIKLEADEDTICKEHTENNSHNNVINEKETVNKHREDVGNNFHDNETDEDLHNVKEEPPCGDAIENDCHDNNTTIKEEPGHEYDEYMDTAYHDTETNVNDTPTFDQGVDNDGHNMKTADITGYVHKITNAQEINNSNNTKQNLTFKCILCGFVVLKSQIKLPSCKQPIELIPKTDIARNSSPAEKIDTYGLCSNCMKEKQNIHGPVKSFADPGLVVETNKSETEQDNQTSLLTDAYNSIYLNYNKIQFHTRTPERTFTRNHILTDYDTSKANIDNEKTVQHTTLTEDLHNASENVQMKIPAESIERNNTNILIDSDESEYYEVEFLESDYTEDSHSNEATASNNEQYTDPEWEPPTPYSAKPQSNTIAKSSKPKQKDSITLHSYKRAPNTRSRCFFSGHCSVQPLQKFKPIIRRRLLKDNNYYVPPHSRVCLDHLKNNDWEEILDSNHGISEFTAEQIEDLFSLLKSGKQLLSKINFDDISSIDDAILQRWMGITREKLIVLVDKVPQMHKICRGMFGLAALLIKHHTGKPNKKLVKLMHMPRRTLESKMKAVKEILDNNGILLDDFLSSKKINKQQNNREQKKSSSVSGSHKRTTKKKC